MERKQTLEARVSRRRNPRRGLPVSAGPERGGNVQEAQAEDGEKDVLLPLGQLERPDDGDGEQEYEEVGDHEHAEVGPPHALDVAVAGGHPHVPVRLQGNAGGERRDDVPEGRDDDDAHDDLGRAAEPLKGEDVEVEEQDRHLGEAQGGRVEEEGVPRRLGVWSARRVPSLGRAEAAARESECHLPSPSRSRSPRRWDPGPTCAFRLPERHL